MLLILVPKSLIYYHKLKVSSEMTLNKTFFLFFILFYQQICFSQTKVDECILGDCVNGKGTLQFSDGRKYVGNFVNSTKSGIGTFSWTNGEIYIGSFSNDMMHGDGIYYFPDGRKYIGHFKKNIKHGKGRFEWPNGKLYQGEFKNDLMNGYGIMTDLNKKSTRGIWHNGNFKKESIKVPKKTEMIIKKIANLLLDINKIL